ncbi:Uncharacterised protein [Dorea longicatena]|nr:Uncharacterised protein [Dorea longicatena]
MRAATCKDVQEPNIFVNTMFCSSCGLCEMYSCMQGLSPRTLMAEYKAGLRANGLRPPKVEAKHCCFRCCGSRCYGKDLRSRYH